MTTDNCLSTCLTLHLDDDVECDVEVSAVDQHVGEEPPHFLLLVRVKYQRTVDIHGAVRPHGLAGVGEEDDVVHEHGDLAQAHQQQEHRGRPTAGTETELRFETDNLVRSFVSLVHIA